MVFEDGKPKYTWIDHKSILDSNLSKPDFAANGAYAYIDPTAAFKYDLDIRKCDKVIYAIYNINAPMAESLEPGATWSQYIKSMTDQNKIADAEIAKITKANAANMENMYKEIFR